MTQLETTIRNEIARRNLTPTQIAKGTGLPFSTVCEFLRGTRDRDGTNSRKVRMIGIDKVGKITEYLNLELVPKPQPAEIWRY